MLATGRQNTRITAPSRVIGTADDIIIMLNQITGIITIPGIILSIVMSRGIVLASTGAKVLPQRCTDSDFSEYSRACNA